MPTTSALYSLASSRARPVAGGSSIGVASTQSAAPGPVTPAPICARPSPRTTAARSPLGSLPTCSRTAIVPTAAYRPSSRGTMMTLRASALLCAASTAAWISGSSSRTGTTMPGSTTESASGSTGSFSVSVMPRSTVTALRLFQRSRESARSEHSFLERPRLRSGEGLPAGALHRAVALGHATVEADEQAHVRWYVRPVDVLDDQTDGTSRAHRIKVVQQKVRHVTQRTASWRVDQDGAPVLRVGRLVPQLQRLAHLERGQHTSADVPDPVDEEPAAGRAVLPYARDREDLDRVATAAPLGAGELLPRRGVVIEIELAQVLPEVRPARAHDPLGE